jgi:hypothetical protein
LIDWYSLVGSLFLQFPFIIIDFSLPLDETSIDKRNMYRTMGWAPRGERTDRLEQTLQGTRYTAIVAISLDGCLALQVLEGGPWREDFEEFIRAHLVSPFPSFFPVIFSLIVF